MTSAYAADELIAHDCGDVSTCNEFYINLIRIHFSKSLFLRNAVELGVQTAASVVVDAVDNYDLFE